MASKSNRFEDNAPGKFYVDHDCIFCGFCAGIAPENFAPSKGLDHDVVIKQPSSDREFKLCMEALDCCPVEAIGEDGA